MIRVESIFEQRRFEIFVLLFRFYTAGLHMLIEDFKERLKYMCCYKYKLMIKCIRRPQVGLLKIQALEPNDLQAEDHTVWSIQYGPYYKTSIVQRRSSCYLYRLNAKVLAQRVCIERRELLYGQ